MPRDTLARDAGTASVEFVALLPQLLLVAALVWQLLLTVSVATAAENAARTGSRAQSLGSDGGAAAVESLSPWMRAHARAAVGHAGDCDGGDVGGEGERQRAGGRGLGGEGERQRAGGRGLGQATRVTVCVGVPLLWPGVSFPELVVVREAEFPSSI